MAGPAWYDIEMRARRLEALCKQVNTKFYKLMEEKPELALSYLDRLTKLETIIQPYIEQMTGVKKLLKQTDKNVIDISV